MDKKTIADIMNSRNGRVVSERLEWLEARLKWVGEFNRSELVDRFGISSQQASADIKLYKELAEGNLYFHKKYKVFRITSEFVPQFESTPLKWLRQNSLDCEELKSIQIEEIIGNPQSIDPNIFRTINTCYKKLIPIKIEYASLTVDRSIYKELVISPHTIVSTPIRWHVRAWDSTNKRFSDFPISRITKAIPEPNASWVPKEADTEWNTKMPIIIAPADGLSLEKSHIIQNAFGMKDGHRIIFVRRCLVYYMLASMQLLGAVREYKGLSVNPNLRIKVVNYKELLPLVSSVAKDIESPCFNNKEDIAEMDMVWKASFEKNKILRPASKKFVWLGSGLSKIAAAYGNDLCNSLGFFSEFKSALDYSVNPPKYNHFPILITLSGKGEDSINTAKNIVKNADEAGLVVAEKESKCIDILSSIKTNKLVGFYPTRDQRFVNIRSIIYLSMFVEEYIINNIGLKISYKKEEIPQLWDDAIAKSGTLANELLLKPTWKNKNFVILGIGYNTTIQHTWKSVLSESGVISPQWADLKDYTHGDHRNASLNLDNIYFVIETEETRKYCDIFYKRFSQVFDVFKIKLQSDVYLKFWENLFYVLNITYMLSQAIGYEGKRPPKNDIVHGWRGWGSLSI